jgi:hypothetical protein
LARVIKVDDLYGTREVQIGQIPKNRGFGGGRLVFAGFYEEAALWLRVI